MRIADPGGASPQLLCKHRPVHHRHRQFAKQRRAPDVGPEMPAVVAEEHGIDRHHAAHATGVLDRPGKRKRPAEIVRDEVDRSVDAGGAQKLLDEIGHAAEGRLVVGRHFRMAEARQIRRNAPARSPEALGYFFPHDTAIGIAVEQQHRPPVAPFGDVDIGAANANLACGLPHDCIVCHRYTLNEGVNAFARERNSSVTQGKQSRNPGRPSDIATFLPAFAPRNLSRGSGSGLAN